VVLERLLPRFDIACLWFNPNIQPAAEHDLRLENAQVVAEHFGVEMMVEPREEEAWLRVVAGHEHAPEGGTRCTLCIASRLQRAAQVAAAGGYEFLATTLTVGPRKPAKVIHPQGQEAAQKAGLQFLAEDFGRAGGFARSVELSRQLGLYRQRYCGCNFARR
jgi:predicted adenine nucleotide alpha hydrolase (AANH) superfamily ATPase